MAENLIRAAVASQGGQTVDRHFGRASRFELYLWNGRSFAWEGERTVPALCGEEGHGEGLGTALARFSDCRFVLAAAAGPAVVQGLAACGIAFLSTEDPVVPALARVAASPLYRNVFIPRSTPRV